MFMELGFLNALFDSSVEVIHRLDADLIIISKSRFSLVASQQFTRRRLYQARSVQGVESASPLYVEYNLSLWTNPDAVPPENAPTRPIRVLAFDTAQPVLRIPEVSAHLEQLKLPDTALIDTESKPFYGERAPGIERQLARRSIQVVGTFRLGTDFTTNGNLIMSDTNFAKFFPDRVAAQGSLSEVDVGVLKVAPGADPGAVRAAVVAALPDDIAVLTVDEWVTQEMDFWATTSPIGFVFGLGMMMGFIIGAVICYQILSADVGDHLAQYATLKAIGYGNRYLTKVVLQEALLLSVVGYLPGLVLGWLLYEALAGWTGLPMRLTPYRSGLLLGLTVLMCSLSGVIALRKVQAADPAEVF
jgi:putative ABC transport system permease protein